MSQDLQALLDEVIPPKVGVLPSGTASSNPPAYTTAQRAQGVPRPACETWPSGTRRGIAEVKYTHDAMIDLIIANPAISQNALAQHFGYSATWVSNIIASDSFQSRLAERTKELVDPVIVQTVEHRFKALILRSMEILQEKLNRPSDEIPDQLALRTLELSTRAAGYGARNDQPPGPAVNINVHLESLGDNLTKLLRRKKAEVIDAEVED